MRRRRRQQAINGNGGAIRTTATAATAAATGTAVAAAEAATTPTIRRPPRSPQPVRAKEEPPPPPDEPRDLRRRRTSDHCSPEWPWWPRPWDLGQPPPVPGGGGGGGSAPEVPSGRPGMPPPMQLPPEPMPPATEPVAPSVIDVRAGVGIAAAELPIPPITLPVIVAPATGLGGGGGSPGSPVLPGTPRGVTAEPPAGREPLPANVGSNVAVPASSYRIGYTDYLRSAGIVPGSGLGSARRCGHACTHRRRGIGWISPGEGGPCGTHKRHRTVCELTNCPPLRGRTAAHSGLVERGLYACQPPRHPRRQCGARSRPTTRGSVIAPPRRCR